MERQRIEALGADEIHLWYLFTDPVDDAGIRRFAAHLSDEESARAARFVFAKDRKSSIVSWGWVRETLSRYADVEPAEWRFRREEFGKPEIEVPSAAPDLRFNLSHTTGLSACVVHRRRDVGVDVEFIERKSATEEIARRSFAPAEFEELRRQPEDLRRDRFFDYWTLKEAYIKAVGRGISLGLQEFAFDLASPGSPSISFTDKLDDRPGAWTFYQDHPGPLHRAAVAVRASPDTGLDLNIRTFELGR